MRNVVMMHTDDLVGSNDKQFGHDNSSDSSTSRALQMATFRGPEMLKCTSFPGNIRLYFLGTSWNEGGKSDLDPTHFLKIPGLT